jgi:hypothetical protein
MITALIRPVGAIVLAAAWNFGLLAWLYWVLTYGPNRTTTRERSWIR